MTYSAISSGLPQDNSVWLYLGFIAVFWLSAIGFTWLALQKYCTTVRILPTGKVDVQICYPHRRIRQWYAFSDLQDAAKVIETEDNDGDPYFLCQLSIGYPFAQPVVIAEGSRAQCEAARLAFNEAVLSS